MYKTAPKNSTGFDFESDALNYKIVLDELHNLSVRGVGTAFSAWNIIALWDTVCDML